MTNLKNLTFAELEEFILKEGQSKFRAKQIYEWLYRGVENFEQMTNLSKDFRAHLATISYISKHKIVKKLQSAIDETTKYLLKLEDDNYIESVLMKYHHGNTVCISSQVGCRMGCKFCASTKSGLVRNLSAAEIIDQVIAVREDCGERISNIVLMGIGEPLDNYENVMTFIQNAIHPWGLNIGQRHISISTCGLVDKMKRLTDEKLQVSLSVSLHAYDNETRNKIMPVNKKYNVDELLQACRQYIEKTNRRLSFEYALIAGVNDSPAQARGLAKKLKNMLCYVNLIPVNPISEESFNKTSRENAEIFQKELMKEGITATIRRELGSDINASCGQLRSNYIKESLH